MKRKNTKLLESFFYFAKKLRLFLALFSLIIFLDLATICFTPTIPNYKSFSKNFRESKYFQV